MAEEKTVPLAQYNALADHTNRLERERDQCRREYRSIALALDEFIRAREEQHANGGPSVRVDAALAALETLAFADAIDPPLTHVACIYRGQVWSLPAPFRHPHVIRLISEMRPESCTGQAIDSGRDSDGFLDGSGRFLTREEALPVALQNGQVKGGRIIGGVLTSEDLW